MLVADIIDQYCSTQDHDLRYMALREHVLNIQTPWNEQDLLNLVSRALMPALYDQDRNISELVSTQIFPHIALINESQMELSVILPLCRELQNPEINTQDNSQVLQSLKNILANSNVPLHITEPLQIYTAAMLSMRDRSYIAWETFTMLLQHSIDNHVIESIFPQLYRLSLEDGRNAAFKSVRAATSKLSPRAMGITVLQYSNLTDGHLKLLAAITEEASCFRTVYMVLIDKLLELPFTTEVVTILQNLSIWLLPPARDTSSAANFNLSAKLYAKCHGILKDFIDDQEMISDIEDTEQVDYLRQLSDEESGDEIGLEEDDDFTITLRQCIRFLGNIRLQVPAMITDALNGSRYGAEALLSILQDGRIEDHNNTILEMLRQANEEILRKVPLKYLRSLQNAGLECFSAEYVFGRSLIPSDSTLTDAVRILREARQINVSTRCILEDLLRTKLAIDAADLTRLELDIDALSELLKFEDLHDTQDLIGELLLPHLKPNKNFSRTIKVGNMKQAIDDGVALRLSCYALLQQLPVSYNCVCLILEECVEKGFKDEASIKEAATLLFIDKIERVWPDLRVRDAIWFLEKLCPRIQDRLDKCIAAQPNASATSQQIDDWTRGLNSLERTTLLLNSKCAVITNDLR
ncbi:LADA_0H17348g1_1 [Lachancea dasiensis]|uniref:LADA_0H17348g1_1 n=1 Tax=Lachancea dasiensis TaxID=1072105 RepID=A0A1G4K5H5_9SACH|nr:LADA_0H17348g1_1 [Lachancea dasiensis]